MAIGMQNRLFSNVRVACLRHCIVRGRDIAVYINLYR